MIARFMKCFQEQQSHTTNTFSQDMTSLKCSKCPKLLEKIDLPKLVIYFEIDSCTKYNPKTIVFDYQLAKQQLKRS